MKKCILALSLAAVVVFGAVISTGNTVLAEDVYHECVVCAEYENEYAPITPFDDLASPVKK